MLALTQIERPAGRFSIGFDIKLLLALSFPHQAWFAEQPGEIFNVVPQISAELPLLFPFPLYTMADFIELHPTDAPMKSSSTAAGASELQILGLQLKTIMEMEPSFKRREDEEHPPVI